MDTSPASAPRTSPGGLTSPSVTQPHARRPVTPTALAWLLLAATLTACTALPATDARALGATSAPAVTAPLGDRLSLLGSPDVLMLGEQHDAPEHQQLQHAVVQALAQRHTLAAVVLEMADTGQGTGHLPPDTDPTRVQQALAWRQNAWPWEAYGPAIMAAVRAGVPVLGGNLPRSRHTEVMRDAQWDVRVPPDVLARQQAAVIDGHCGLLPASQTGPMTRIQLARDVHMAQALASAAVPGQTVLLLTGSQHAHRQWGVPLHLPGHLAVKSVRLDASGPRPDDGQAFDAVWPTAPLAPKDHCAELARRKLPA